MRRARVAIAAAALLLLPAAAGAVLYLDINAPGGKRMPIALPDLAAVSGDASLARALPGVVAGDLAMTGLFDVVPREAHLERIVPDHFDRKALSFPDWKLSGAEAVVVGRVETRGSEVVLEFRLYDVTLGTLMVGRRYAGPSRLARRMAHRFANEVYYAFTGVRGIFDTDVAFTARPEGGRGKEVWVVGLDGQDLRKVTDNRSFNLFPKWSPDGKGIAYTSFRTGVPLLVYRSVAEGTDRVLTREGNTKTPGSFSPDGRLLYASLSRGGNADIYAVPLDGGAPAAVVGGQGIETSPSVSPDGTRIAFVSDRGGSPQVYVAAIGTPGGRRVSSAGYYATSPAWAPDGTRIAFTGRAGSRYALYTVRPDGSDQRVVASSESGDCLDPSFSPDARFLVYTFRKKGYSELKIVSADGRWERTLFSGLAGIGSPSWSPRR